MTIFYRPFRLPPPFLPVAGSAGLLEKRLSAYSQLGLSDAAAKIGAWNHDVDNDLWLDDDTGYHVNHGNDPGTSTLNLVQSAATNFTRVRGLTDTLSLTDFAHASLEGYHAPGSGGDPDLSQHTATFDDTSVAGQPVYVSGNNTVALATANNAVTSEVVGLVLTGAGTGNSGVYITEGSVVRADWTSVVGAAALTPGTTYFLSETTPGILTATAPTARGNYVVRVGKALSTTTMDIEIAIDLLL